MDVIKTIVENRVARIVLNRPEKRNALSPELVEALKTSIKDLLGRDDVKVIVIKSADKPFCAGADLAHLAKIRDFSFEENLADSQSLRALFDLIHGSHKIFISQVEGPALAGGCGLASICDFCFATEDAQFGYTESRIGFVPALVAVYLRQRLRGSDIRDLLLSGRIISAADAQKMGLVNEVIPAGAIETAVADFASKLCATVSSASVEHIKNLLKSIEGMEISQALDFAAELNARARSGADCIAGIDAFLNKTKLQW